MFKLITRDYKLSIFIAMDLLSLLGAVIFYIFTLFNITGIIVLTIIFSILFIIFIIMTIIRYTKLTTILKKGTQLKSKILNIKYSPQYITFSILIENETMKNTSKITIYADKKLRMWIIKRFKNNDMIQIKFYKNFKTIIIPEILEKSTATIDGLSNEEKIKLKKIKKVTWDVPRSRGFVKWFLKGEFISNSILIFIFNFIFSSLGTLLLWTIILIGRREIFFDFWIIVLFLITFMGIYFIVIVHNLLPDSIIINKKGFTYYIARKYNDAFHGMSTVYWHNIKSYRINKINNNNKIKQFELILNNHSYKYLIPNKKRLFKKIKRNFEIMNKNSF